MRESGSMTPKSVISIDFKEIESIEIRCESCKGMLTLPVTKENVQPSQSCPGCNKQLWGLEDSDIFNNLHDLVIGLSYWQRRKKASSRWVLPCQCPEKVSLSCS